FDQSQESVSIPPKGKHLFGAVKVGERGQIVLPKKARDLFGIQPGDLLVVLGDEDPITGGLALMHGNTFLKAAEFFNSALSMTEMPNAKPEETCR
ncbi:MAG: AbrB/MazE/SpoVT family DNA-binding domain-containing protein, partial [Acutalibacteraceae bacterium]